MEAIIAAFYAKYGRNGDGDNQQRTYSNMTMDHAGSVASPISHDMLPASGVTQNSTPIIWRCPFGFVGCDHIARGLPQWDQHCQWHTRGQLPRYLECPFIGCSWSCRSDTHGSKTWEQRLLHIITSHEAGGTLLTHATKGMAEYLYEEHMLDDEQAQSLRFAVRRRRYIVVANGVQNGWLPGQQR